LAKTNYKYEKRQKQIDKKKKHDEKLKRRQEQKQSGAEAGTAKATPEQPGEK
jgi:hypothetical protein